MIEKGRWGVIAVLWLAAPTASADDVVSQDDVCEGAKIGSECRFDGGQGVCRESKCTGLDYSTGSPKTVKRDCLRCLPPEPKVQGKSDAKSEPKVEAKTDAQVDAKTEAKAAAPTPAAPAPSEPTPAATPPKATVSETKTAPAAVVPTKAEPASAAPPAAKSCAVDPAPASLASVGLGVALLLLVRRRSAR